MAQCVQPWPAAQAQVKAQAQAQAAAQVKAQAAAQAAAQAGAQAGAQKRGAASSPSTKADWRRVAKRRRKTVDAETKRLVTGCMQCLCHSSLMPYVEAVGASYLVRQPPAKHTAPTWCCSLSRQLRGKPHACRRPSALSVLPPPKSPTPPRTMLLAVT
eukprot:COSAG01_NODE_16278_length_1251_cov_2.191840_2_plen_158_part_00